MGLLYQYRFLLYISSEIQMKQLNLSTFNFNYEDIFKKHTWFQHFTNML